MKKAVNILTKQDAIEYVINHPHGLADLEEEFKDDEEIVFMAVSSYGFALEFASKRIRSNKDIVKAAILKDPRAITFACKELRDDPEMRELAYKLSGRAFIVDPIAMEVFSVLDGKMINSTVKRENGIAVLDKNGEVEFDEKAMAKHPFYQRFKKFYDGSATAADILEYEKILLKRKKENLKNNINDMEEKYNF